MESFFKRHKIRFCIVFFSFLAALFFSIWLINRARLNNKVYLVRSSAEDIKSLPYLGWYSTEKTGEKSGVTLYNRKKAFKGINIYCPRNLSTAYLMDMRGKILHKWSVRLKKHNSWTHVKMLKTGDLLALVTEKKLIKLDWGSNVQWAKKMRIHHDIAVDDDDDIWVISRKEKVVFIFGFPVPILDDYITVLSSHGEIKKNFSLFKVLREKITFDRVAKIYRFLIDPKNRKVLLKRKNRGEFIFGESTPVDLFHTNSIEIIKNDVSGLAKKNDILISLRELDLIGIVDLEEGRLVWSWGQGILNKPHHPTLLANGNILVFDNGFDRKYSRVIELDPLTNQIVWECKADGQGYQFFTDTRGASQRLPNGNTLITVSNKGYVFEVTINKEVVWEFYNPETKGKERSAIYRMIRISDPDNYPVLKKLGLNFKNL